MNVSTRLVSSPADSNVEPPLPLWADDNDINEFHTIECPHCERSFATRVGVTVCRRCMRYIEVREVADDE